MESQEYDVRRLSGALGAEIMGIDLGGALTDELRSTVTGLLAEHSVVAFRGQRSDLDRLTELTEWLGGFGETPFLRSMDGHPGVVQVVAEAEDTTAGNFGGVWHSDWSFQPRPPKYTILMAKDIPPVGGDTMWSCQYLAYETLSAGLRATLDQLDVVHSAGRSYSPDGAIAKTATGRTMQIDVDESANEEYVHPAVITNPDTGRRALFVNPTYSVRFDGWSVADSQPLLDHLSAHATSPEFTCRLRWSDDTITIWDNRCTQHNALNDYRGHRRELHRTTVRS
ncbi:MAG: TauD/TfdA dioxygenase family protein [Acidimicrobiales bacterium]